MLLYESGGGAFLLVSVNVLLLPPPSGESSQPSVRPAERWEHRSVIIWMPSWLMKLRWHELQLSGSLSTCRARFVDSSHTDAFVFASASSTWQPRVSRESAESQPSADMQQAVLLHLPHAHSAFGLSPHGWYFFKKPFTWKAFYFLTQKHLA